MTKKYCIGLMSGTSLDGVDIVLIEPVFTNTYLKEPSGLFQIPKIQIQSIQGYTYPFDSLLKDRIKALIEQKTENLLEVVCKLNIDLSLFMGACINDFVNQHKITASDVLLIASHGQTLYHISDNQQSYTFQIGDGSILKQETNIPVVFNFRMADIAVGGQGAPLVPFYDLVTFYTPHYTRSIHNIGGISNMTVIPKSFILPFAFDTGPGNMVIDECMRILYGREFDDQGEIARSGIPLYSVLEDLLQHPYFNLQLPKSTGRELFGQNYTHSLLSKMKEKKPEDIIATVTFLTAVSITEAYQNYVFPKVSVDEVIFGGGGVQNNFLMEILQDRLAPISLKTHSSFGIDDSLKEAVAFAILGYTHYLGIPNNVPSCTGAKQSVILGQTA